MARLLGLDIGSSSVIAGILEGKEVLHESPRVYFRSECEGPKVTVEPDELLSAVKKVIGELGEEVQKVDAIQFAVMCPAWVAMDKDGRPLTPLVTHQDRRSIAEAKELEVRIGEERHLEICGARPVPGGISSTTWAWYLRHEPERLRGVHLVGHLNTFLHRQITGERVIDPSNASFTGLYETLTLGGWSEELCANLGVSKALLPRVLEADVVAGRVTADAARRFGLREGTPVCTGLMDGSAGMLLAGARHGQLFNVVGSTDVLALCTETPKQHPRLLTRALGVGRKWLAVSTLAAAGSAIYWAREQFFPEMTLEEFAAFVHKLSKEGPSAAGGVTFAPYMAGDRTSVEQRKGAFDGITLATTRTNLLSAIIEGLIRASAERIPLLLATGTKPLETVVVSGGGDRLDKIMQRDWPGEWKFEAITDATMRGLGTLEPREA
ncbi:MAG: FGGY family carbohydrate kinase [Chthoniobacterales bacterium]|nr:FGGY family carbohydrate kinase [Chthoniobacterales bacterium]